LPIERTARIRDLISARSGVYHPASNSGDSSANAPPRGSVKPGTYFLYNNWDFNAAGGAFELLTKRSIYQAFADDIAKPLQLQDFKLAKQELSGDSSKSKFLAYHFTLSTRDMARIGHLMLANGRWGDKQVVPNVWVDSMLQVTTPSIEMHPPYVASQKQGYGYMWWLMEEPEASPLAGAYSAQGAYGQFILVIPKRQMVITHKFDLPDGAPFNPGLSWKDFLVIARKMANSSCP
jgi:CubicO group peptidase (beta-lactamase class C family)